MSYGFVYVLSHPDMPNLYKIGHTAGSPHKRAQELSRATACPRDFDLVCYAEYANAERREKEIHRLLHEYRVNDRREFFKAPMSIIASLVLNEELSLATVEGEAPVHIWEEQHAHLKVVGGFKR